MSEQPVDLAAKIAEIKARKAQLSPPVIAQPPAETWNPDVLLPDLGGNLSDDEKALDAFVDQIDIVDAYIKFCGKMTPNTQGKTEGIKISCPNPAHPDKDPSAWINLDKQTYFCGGCEEGGDAHDIAALNLGYPVPGYKTGETFHKLREQMAESFGFRRERVPGGTITWIEPPAPPVPPPVSTSPALSVVSNQDAPQAATGGSVLSDEDLNLAQERDANDPEVAHMWADEDDEEELVVYPTINWRNLIPEDTFVFEYMKACTNDDAPEEYHFWHALLALGLVVGRNVTLDDTQPVYGNILLCILGATGTGKSRSRRYLNQVLKAVSPYTEDGTRTNGVKIIPVPSSGEYLVSQFVYEGRDPTNNKVSLGMQPVTGIVDFDEMSALLGRANRTGSTLKPTIMQLADATADVRIGGLARGDFIAEGPFCTITASTQPKAIRTLMNHNDTGSGFLNRWIFAGGRTKQIEALGGSRSSITVDLATAIEELKKVRGWGGISRSIEMDDDAYIEYEKFFRKKIEPAKTKDQTDLLKRIDLIAKKLMLLLTINLRLSKVPVQVVRAVIELFDYVVECYGILNSNIGVTVMQDVMQDIERHILRHQAKTGRGASARDIAKYTKRKNYNLEQIKKALDVMTSLGVVHMDKPVGAQVGRPTIRYRAASE